MTKALITGGTGFIGSNLAKALVTQGYAVRVLDNNFRGKLEHLRPVIDEIELFEGDVRNIDDVKKAVHGVNIVYHLAFINGTEFFYKYPGLVLDVGIRGHLNVMDACRNGYIDAFIYASSSEVYQTPPLIPTPENVPGSIPDIKNPRYSYGTSKLCGELLTLHYATDTQMRRIIFRPHNVYGPAMGFEHVIPQLVKKICKATDFFKNNEAEVEIQGSGKETRAFCYIDDAIEGILIAADKGTDGDIFHVGTQEEIQIKALVLLISEILGLTIHIKPGRLQKGSVKRRCPDITKLIEFGYLPKVSLEDGLRQTIQWYKQYYLNSKEL